MEVEILRINKYDLLAAFLPGAASTAPTGGVPLVHHLQHGERQTRAIRRGLLRDCEIFANFRLTFISSSKTLNWRATVFNNTSLVSAVDALPSHPTVIRI